MHGRPKCANGVGEPASFQFMQLPGSNLDGHAQANQRGNRPTVLQANYSTPEPSIHYGEPLDHHRLIEDMQLPSDALLIKLVELFFDKLGHMFPCFHRKNFEYQLKAGSLKTVSPLVLYTICCVTARYHPELAIRMRQSGWYDQAKLSYELTQRDPHPGLRTLQSVLILVFYGYTAGDFSSSWLYLGKAWRQVVALGVNRMDTLKGAQREGLRHGDAQIDNLEHNQGITTAEREEYRRTLWMLFIMDRSHGWPTGWPNAIPETAFKVDLPIADNKFQAMGNNVFLSLEDNIAFVRDLNRLVGPSNSGTDPMDAFHYVCIAHVLLGRISELVHSLHDVPDTTEYAETCERLDAHLIKFRLGLPRHVTSVLEAKPHERGHVIWLQVTLNVAAMILHYRCVKGVAVANASSQFEIVVAAAQNIANIVKDTSRISIDLLMSAHIGASLYVAACILVIQWHITNDPCVKQDIDLFVLVFERMNEVFVFMGLKFSLALEYDLKRSQKSLEDLRDKGFKGFLSDCSKWTHVKEEVQRRGIIIDIT